MSIVSAGLLIVTGLLGGLVSFRRLTACDRHRFSIDLMIAEPDPLKQPAAHRSRCGTWPVSVPNKTTTTRCCSTRSTSTSPPVRSSSSPGLRERQVGHLLRTGRTAP